MRILKIEGSIDWEMWLQWMKQGVAQNIFGSRPEVEEKWAGPASDGLEGVEGDLWDLKVKNWSKKTNDNRGTAFCRNVGKGS